MTCKRFIRARVTVEVEESDTRQSGGLEADTREFLGVVFRRTQCKPKWQMYVQERLGTIRN